MTITDHGMVADMETIIGIVIIIIGSIFCWQMVKANSARSAARHERKKEYFRNKGAEE